MKQLPRIMPPVYLLLTLIAMWVLHNTMPMRQLISTPYNYSGLALLLLGISVTVMSAGLFSKLGTPLKPFEQSTMVVTTGMFRFTRNPMYLGMVIGLIGMAIYQGSLAGVFPIPVFIAIIQYRFILNEEKFMEGLFGDEYLAYKREVRRWF